MLSVTRYALSLTPNQEEIKRKLAEVEKASAEEAAESERERERLVSVAEKAGKAAEKVVDLPGSTRSRKAPTGSAPTAMETT